MASALDMDLEGKGTHCSQCMRSLSGVTALTLEDDPLGVAYCSPGCKAHANDQHHSLLFSLEPVPVLGFDDVPAPGPRRAAQAALAEHLKKSGISRSLVALRLFTHQTMSDTQKALRPLDKPQSVLPEPDAGTYGSDYTFGDHLERLRFLEVHADDKEVKFSKAVLDAALNAGEELLTDEQYNTFKGKVAYNGIGVVYNGGRDRPRKNGTKEEDTFEWTRTPLGTQRQVGTALYRVSSYVRPTCHSFSHTLPLTSSTAHPLLHTIRPTDLPERRLQPAPRGLAQHFQGRRDHHGLRRSRPSGRRKRRGVLLPSEEAVGSWLELRMSLRALLGGATEAGSEEG